MLRWLIPFTLLAAAACSTPESEADAGSLNACSCSVTFNGESKTLQCGEAACVNGERFSCDARARLDDEGPCTDNPGPFPPRPDGGSDQPDSGTPNGPTPPPPAADWNSVQVGTSSLSAVSAEFGGPRWYVVGDNGLCLETSSSVLSACGLPTTTSKLTAVSAYSDRSVLVGGTSGFVAYRRDLGLPGELSWRVLDSLSSSVRAVAWPTFSHAFVFGDAGLARRYDLSSSKAPGMALTGIPADVSLFGVSTTHVAPHVLFAVGSKGKIFRLDDYTKGSALQEEVSGTSARLNGVLAELQGGKLENVTAVGEGGLILGRSSSGLWLRQPSGVTADLYGVFEGVGGIYAVGAQGTVLFRRDGQLGWKPQKSGTFATLRGGALRVVSIGNLRTFIVGDSGTLLYRDN